MKKPKKETHPKTINGVQPTSLKRQTLSCDQLKVIAGGHISKRGILGALDIE